MQERIKGIIDICVGFWNKYSKKQKTIVFSVLGTVVLALVILGLILSKSTYVSLMKCEDTKSASEVVDLLSSEGIESKIGDDYTSVLVEKEFYNDAVIIVGKNDIPSSGMSYEDAFTNDISTSESEKKLKTTLALQNEVRHKLMQMDGIKDATVFINKPEEDYTILAQAQDASVSVMLSFQANESLTSENAVSLATFLSNIVGNDDTKKITIIDDKGNLLFGGESSDVLGGNVNTSIEYKQKLSNMIVSNVKQLLLKYGSYKDVEVGASNIKFDMDKVTELYTQYTPAEGQDQGLYGSSYTYKSEGAAGSSGTPGTDSNDDDTTYEVEGTEGTNSKQESEQITYLPNSSVKNIEYEIGAVVPDQSSMAIVLTSYKVYKQEDLENQGALGDMSWEEYVANNDVKVQQEVDDMVYELVKNTTGIATNRITITAWEQPIFQAKEAAETSYDTFVMIALIVLIVALLLFVVFKMTKPVEVVEQEPELSVEELLASTKEAQSVDDIEFGDKSETRKMIEKFVDENPEAVALLLRNWLNEDWG